MYSSLVPRPLSFLMLRAKRTALKNWEWPGDEARSGVRSPNSWPGLVGRSPTSAKNGRSGVKPILGFVPPPEYRRLQSDCSSSSGMDTIMCLARYSHVLQLARTYHT